MGVGVGLMLRVAVPSMPPARARSMTAPEASAVAVVRSPVVGESAAFFASLADQTKETRGSSTSPTPVCVKARALKSRRAPMSSVEESGVISILVRVVEPNGVPSLRVPGE